MTDAVRRGHVLPEAEAMVTPEQKLVVQEVALVVVLLLGAVIFKVV